MEYISVVLGLFDTGLAVIRALGRKGIPVYGFDYNPKQPGFKSRYCISEICPDPISEPDKLLEYLTLFKINVTICILCIGK